MIARLIVVQVIAVLVLAALLWVALPAIGQEIPPTTTVVPHSHKDPAGEFYATWQQPDIRDSNGERHRSCCNQMDCEPVQIIRRGDKLYIWNHSQRPNEYVEVPRSKWEHVHRDQRFSPDGQNHGCVNHTGALCLVLGEGT